MFYNPYYVNKRTNDARECEGGQRVCDRPHPTPFMYMDQATRPPKTQRAQVYPDLIPLSNLLYVPVIFFCDCNTFGVIRLVVDVFCNTFYG